jgi:DNA-binding NarL/FixJ family response regulator
MIDRDIIERVGALLGGRVYGPRRDGSERHQPIWRAQVNGCSPAEIMALLKVSKSTVYRHTKGKVRRMRVVSPRRRDGEVREQPLQYCRA